MKIYLQIELLLSETALPDGKLLVDEFDCKDRLGSLERYCFLDAGTPLHQPLGAFRR